MRILVLTNFYPPHHIGGYELRCREVVAGLRRRGHEVRILTGRWRTEAATPSDDGAIRALHLSWGPPYPPEDLPGLLAAEAADRRTLRDLLDKYHPDITDVWGMEFASQSLVAALLASPAAVHVTLEDIWLRDAWARDGLCAVTQMARKLRVEMPAAVADLCCLASSPPAVGERPVCFASRALAERYAAGGLAPAGASVRLAGIDLAPFRQVAPPLAPPPFVVLSVGQLTASRGQGDLIAAAGRAAQDARCPFPIVVRIVGGGGGAYAEQLHRLAKEYRSDRFSVDLAGPQPPERAATFYAGAHLFVHTSHLPEGLPRVLMEAMAAGVPVVATNTGGQRDILDNGRWGALLPPGQPDALAENILEVMNHLGAWQERAGRARAHAIERFDIEHYVEGHAADLAAAAAPRQDRPGPAIPAPHLPAGEAARFADNLGRAAQAQAARVEAADHPDRVWRVGVVLKRTHRPAAAERLLKRLHESHAGNPVHVRRATFHLAELALVAGRWPEAAALLEQCLAIAPDHRKAAFDLDCARRRALPEHLAGLRGEPAPVA